MHFDKQVHEWERNTPETHSRGYTRMQHIIVLKRNYEKIKTKFICCIYLRSTSMFCIEFRKHLYVVGGWGYNDSKCNKVGCGYKKTVRILTVF